MDTYVVNFIGGPGSGKTVNATLTFAQLKLLHCVAEYVNEYAKKLVWLGDFESLSNQYQVSLKQFRLLNVMNGKVKYIVTDACLLHGLYYNKNYENNVSNVKKTEEKIWECYNKFKNINIFLVRGSWPYEQEGRYQTEHLAKKIDSELENILIDNKLEYMRYDPDKNTISNILDYIKLKSKLG